ncbi:MAG: hypothetical protein ACLGHN_05745 [Bacteriovoracia bacterium]
MKLALVVILYSLSLQLFAWSERGNGGNSIICDDSKQNKFYDAYEAEFRYGRKPVFPYPQRECYDETSCFNLSVTIARDLINRIPDFDTRLKVFMHQKLRSFGDESNFLDNIVLLPIDDMGIAFIPRNCKLHQTVIQREPRVPGDKRYIISNDQWKKLSPHHQAVGIIHELLYYYATHIQRPIKNSEGIRYLNGIIISDEISNLNEQQFMELYHLVYTDHNQL